MHEQHDSTSTLNWLVPHTMHVSHYQPMEAVQGAWSGRGGGTQSGQGRMIYAKQ